MADLAELNLVNDDAVRAFVAILVGLIKMLAEEGHPDFELIWSIVPMRLELPIDGHANRERQDKEIL
ncbi:MAG: hypothetical protein JWN10_1508 [Solirubrobacterales bacterium]|nr:hypothetical protein [Solirubrobacterales bacterium]